MVPSTTRNVPNSPMGAQPNGNPLGDDATTALTYEEGEYLLHERRQEGQACWSPHHGPPSSSARMELLGVLSALTTPAPVHIKMDSTAALASVRRLHRLARTQDHLTRPLILEHDGDIKTALFDVMTQRRNFDDTFHWIKAHASRDDILSGAITQHDADNKQVGILAKRAANFYVDTKSYGATYAYRSSIYRKLVKTAHTIQIQVLSSAMSKYKALQSVTPAQRRSVRDKAAPPAFTMHLLFPDRAIKSQAAQALRLLPPNYDYTV